MDKLLKNIEGCNIYSLRQDAGEIYIHILGYFYDAGFALENDGKDWRYVEFCGYDMPLSEFLAGTEEDLNGWEEQYTRYIEDYTEREVVEFFKSSFAPLPLLYTEITESNLCDNVDDNVYISTIY